jgi:uncharacterized protein (TIGR02145 family)
MNIHYQSHQANTKKPVCTIINLLFFIAVLLLFLATWVGAQITGSVLDTAGNNLEGMDVPVLHNGANTVSDTDGNFSLTLLEDQVGTSESLLDTRDGQVYATTIIGMQTWMAENLNFEPASGSFCYNDSIKNCDTYGRLYTWAAAMGGAPSSSTPSGVQGVCPEGWHVPSDVEWEKLAKYVAKETGLTGKLRDTWLQIAPKLKSATGWTYYSGVTFDDAKSFNTTGPCFPEKHYMLPPEKRLPGRDLQRLIHRRIVLGSCMLPARPAKPVF